MVKNYFIKMVIFVIFLLFNSISMPANAANTYCFDEPTIDKIIVTGEKAVITEKALEQCNIQLSSLEEMVKLQGETLKKYNDTIQKATDLIEKQKKTIESVDELIEKARKEEKSKAFWSKITWTTVGTTIGTVIGIVIMSL